jgi:hypothetical protein
MVNRQIPSDNGPQWVYAIEAKQKHESFIIDERANRIAAFMNTKMLLAADLGLLKAYKVEFRPKASPHLELLSHTVFTEAHQRISEKVTDLAGRNTGSGQGRGGGPMADVHNLELEMKRRSLRQLVSHIETLAQANPGDGCWLAAPKEIMHQVLESLAPPVRGRIEKSVPRDLTKTEPKELLEYFLPDHMTSR